MNRMRFGGKVPFQDRRTGTTVNVTVIGEFVGTGVDAHEEQAIREWIINALASSALAYDGAIEELPKIAGEWGAYVSQQLSPQLAQHFNAHGHLEIGAVHLPEELSTKAAPAPSAPSHSLLEAAAAALATRMGAPIDQAREVAAIVLEVVQAHGGMGATPTKDPYAKEAHGKDPYAKDAHGKDPYGKDPYGKTPEWKK